MSDHLEGQMDLLAWQPPASRREDPMTSHLAASKAELGASAGRLAVLGQLMLGSQTDFEIAAALNRQQTSAGKRRGELRDHGLVEAVKDGDDPATRPAPSGAAAIVWQITALGRAYYAEHMKAAA